MCGWLTCTHGESDCHCQTTVNNICRYAKCVVMCLLLFHAFSFIPYVWLALLFGMLSYYQICYCLHIVWPKSNAKCCCCSTKCIFDEYGDIWPIGRQWAREIVVIIISHKRIHSTAYVLIASHRYDGHQIGSKLQPYVWWLLTARIEKKDAFNEANIQEISIAIDGEAVWPNWTTLN